MTGRVDISRLAALPSVVFLRNAFYPERSPYGVAHRFTGLAHELSPEMHAALHGDGGLAPDARAALLDIFGGLGFETVEEGSTDPDTWWHAWAHHRLVVPAHVPAVYTLKTAPVRLYRLETLIDCHLPRTAEAPKVVCEPLQAVHAALLRAAEAETCFGDFLRTTSFTPREIRDGLLYLSDPNRQMIRLVDPNIFSASLKAPWHFPFQNYIRATSATDPTAYYEGLEVDGLWNFDWVETTVAHSFRRPTAMLDGQAYGAAFLRAVARYADLRAVSDILEVGGGTGDLAGAFLSAFLGAAPKDHPLCYTLQDLSDRLLQRQKQALKSFDHVRYFHGNAEDALPGRDAFDVIVCNEVIADLRMTGAAGTVRTATGCFTFLENVLRALKPGGRAFISEFGGLVSGNRCVDHLNHTEHSTHFGALVDCAETLDARARVVSLAEFLGIDPQAPLLCGQHEKYLVIRSVLQDHGVDLDFRAYDRAEFDERFQTILSRIGCGRLDFQPACEGLHFGPDLRQFLVLIIEKPPRLTEPAHAPGRQPDAMAGSIQ